MILQKVFILFAMSTIFMFASQAYKVVGVKSNDTLSVREHPTSDSAKVGELAHNESDIFLDGCTKIKKSTWCQLDDPSAGWVNMRFLQKTTSKYNSFEDKKISEMNRFMDQEGLKNDPNIMREKRSISSKSNHLNTYENIRFGFVGKYPSNIFVKEMYSDNGDGVTLSSHDEQITCSFSGINNVMGENLSDEYKSTLKFAPKSNKEVTYSILKGNWYLVTGYDHTNETIFYQKRFLTKDNDSMGVFSGFYIEYPIKDKEKYHTLVQTINENFRPAKVSNIENVQDGAKVDKVYVNEHSQIAQLGNSQCKQILEGINSKYKNGVNQARANPQFRDKMINDITYYTDRCKAHSKYNHALQALDTLRGVTNLDVLKKHPDERMRNAVNMLELMSSPQGFRKMQQINNKIECDSMPWKTKGCYYFDKDGNVKRR